MIHKTPLQKKFEKILNQRSYEDLEEYKDPTLWRSMSYDEQKVLALLFVQWGSTQLLQGSSKVIDSFEIANAILPNNPQIYFEEGQVYLTQSQNARCLMLACQSFSRCTQLDENFNEAWQEWGRALLLLGKFHQEANYFLEADEKFAKVKKALLSQPSLDLFLWEWGQCWYYLGKLSGEAVDFYQALEKYRLPKEVKDPLFWNQYGDVIVSLSMMMSKKEMLLDAIECYHQATVLGPNEFDGWFNLACCDQHLFEIDGDEASYHRAHENFTVAAKLNKDEMNLWLRWGQLQFSFGRLKSSGEAFQSSFEKFHQAELCEPNHPLVLARWGEALIASGAAFESVDDLWAAEKKLVRSLMISPENSETWSIYGVCLIELGRYFRDEAFYEKAVEKFHYGLSLNPNEALHWYGLALSHFALGEIRSDFSLIEQSLLNFSRALDAGAQSFPHFWNDWGVALMHMAEITHNVTYVESAIEKFEKSLGSFLENETPNPEWLYNYGCALDFLGDLSEEVAHYEKAIQFLTKALTIDPDYSNARYNLALTLSHLGEATADVESLSRSIEQFQILLSSDYEDEMGWNDWGLALINLAELVRDGANPEFSQALYEQAEAKLMQAVALGCTPSYYNLACLYSLIGSTSEAMHYIERAEQAGVLPSLDDIMNDEWLEALRQTNAFRQFITHISTKKDKDEE